MSSAPGESAVAPCRYYAQCVSLRACPELGALYGISLRPGQFLPLLESANRPLAFTSGEILIREYKACALVRGQYPIVYFDEWLNAA